MAREINLVPDIKEKMIRDLRLKNRISFICVATIFLSILATVAFGLIVGGQQLIKDNKNSTLTELSNKLKSFSDLDDFLTIRDQLGNLSALTSNKKVLSRTFNILSSLLPTGADTITISELNVNLSEEKPTFSFDAQANAGKEPFIDYNVLDSFKKSMKYMRYDYGNYVDKNNNKIPAYCMLETGEDGAIFNDESKGLYALWTVNAEGCETPNFKAEDYSTEDYDGLKVVRIWRTPQFSDWYKETEVEGKPYMSLDGIISGVEHFNSSCISYTGTKEQNSTKPKWTESNDSCLLVPDGDEGIKISESSNGRDSGNELVLRFSAVISFDPEVYNFDNFHMLALAPSGRRNVTDSYVQIQAMFSERAKDCAEGDSACSASTNNSNGGGN